jgi:hypothetical protein
LEYLQYLQDRVVQVPYEKVVYQDKVDVKYVDVERVVDRIVRKEVPGLRFPVKKSSNFGSTTSPS